MQKVHRSVFTSWNSWRSGTTCVSVWHNKSVEKSSFSKTSIKTFFFLIFVIILESGDSAHWTFLLSDEMDNSQPVGVINLTSNKSIINFKINGNFKNVSNCSPYEVEIANVNGKWVQITNQLSNMSLVLYKNYTGKLSLMVSFL